MVTDHIALHALSEDECQALIAIAGEQYGVALPEDAFADVMLGLFEEIPGFETMPPAKCSRLLNHLWSLYMVKKSATADIAENTPEATAPDAKASEAVEVDLSRPIVRAAIDQGKALIAEGKTKADAARAIYDEIKDESKEVIVAAFMEGATLTAKGALTYWYNCRRKASKQAAQPQ